MGRTWLKRIKPDWADVNLMSDSEAGPTKILKNQKVAAAENALTAAVAKAQRSSAGSKTTKAQAAVTNVGQGRETKGEELTEDADECFVKNECQRYTEQFREDIWN
ncbi:hypothetical protein scyTo_0002113 [Scyliorhinus torazame]|uniref:Uncharacterized protein n=1 Tax=Scyliorhinus torazame TaxID=75743 RepID=A0A401PHR5_SCYTO|nr:hypothetical protein [Scyliorhinus torazame]